MFITWTKSRNPINSLKLDSLLPRLLREILLQFLDQLVVDVVWEVSQQRSKPRFAIIQRGQQSRDSLLKGFFQLLRDFTNSDTSISQRYPKPQIMRNGRGKKERPKLGLPSLASFTTFFLLHIGQLYLKVFCNSIVHLVQRMCWQSSRMGRHAIVEQMGQV